MGCRTESTAPSHCRNQSPISHACTIALEGTHMADSEPPVHKLQVANARPEDSGRGIAHLPRALMAQLALAEGGVIEIVGKRSTPARAVYPYPEDEGLEIIRIDGLQRANAGAGDRKSTRLNPVTNAHLVCRLLLAKKTEQQPT